MLPALGVLDVLGVLGAAVALDTVAAAAMPLIVTAATEMTTVSLRTCSPSWVSVMGRY